jgi:diguanylate cyclase (GGDEF)-like protein
MQAAGPQQTLARFVAFVPGLRGGLFLSWWTLGLLVLIIGLLLYLLMRRQAKKTHHLTASMGALLAQRSQELARTTEAMMMTKQILENLNLTDTITGLHNRRYLSMVIGNDASAVLDVYRNAMSSAPIPNQDLVFYVIGVDQFKQLQNRHGADLVNEILKRTAQVLRKASRETDLVLRWTDEEFLLLTRHTSRTEAHIVADRIRKLMGEQSIRTPQIAIGWSCSVGYAAFPFLASDPEWLGWEKVLDIATTCLQTARHIGPNVWAGVQAKEGIQRETHGKLIPAELGKLVEQGVIQVQSSHPDLFGRRVGEVLG